MFVDGGLLPHAKVLDYWQEDIITPHLIYPLTSISLCMDDKNGIHAAWSRKQTDIYWRMFDPSTAIWNDTVNITQTPNAPSTAPSLSFFGDVHLVWQEGGNIDHIKGNYGFGLPRTESLLPPPPYRWGEQHTVRNSGNVCVNPVFDGNYIAWSEETSTGHYEALYSKYENYRWSVAVDYSNNPTQSARYPQIAYRQASDGGYMVTVWTEGEGPLYSLIARDTLGQITPLYAADVGTEDPSIYTIQRDGYLSYSNGITVDFDTTELQYCLPKVLQDQKQDIEVALYQENPNGEQYQYKLYVDSVPLGTVEVPSGQPLLVDKQIPNSVTHDGEAVLRIESKKGAIVTCDKWQMFTGDHGTVKASPQRVTQENKPVTYINELKQNAPNPCDGKTQFRYQLASAGKTSFKVYNTLGQVVKTLVNQDQQPGIYNLNWDGKDEHGRRVANGIYVYRLCSGTFQSTMKLVIVK